MKRYRGVLIFLAIALLALAGAVWYYNRMLGYLCLGAAGFVTLIVFLLLIGVARKQQQLMDTVFADNDTAASELIRKVNIPVLLMDLNGKIVWRNDALAAVFDGKNVLDVLPNFKPTQPTVQQIRLSGTNYQVMTMPVRRRNARKKLLFQYWLDRTEAAHYQRLYTEQMPYVMLVYMDNYEELAGDRQFHGTAVLAEVERLVSELCRRTGGIYCRYENGRFLCVLEASEVGKLEKEKFQLLEQARHLDTGTTATVSLSVAVGMAPRIAQSEEGARTAMELALGRGGDQVCVKEGYNTRYFGGKTESVEKYTRVKARVKAHALKEIMDAKTEVFIMGHKIPDTDALGAAIGIYRCAKSIDKPAYIVIDSPPDSIKPFVEGFRNNPDYADRMFITSREAQTMVGNSSVVVVVDTNKPNYTECEELLYMTDSVVVLDHHRQGREVIKGAVLSYIEPYASSACELVTEIVQYFDEKLKLKVLEADCLYAGIMLDTSNFLTRTGVRTFEAAAYLRRNGADVTRIRKMFRERMEDLRAKSKTIAEAEIFESCFAISECESYGLRNPTVVAAQAANELLSVMGVKASFVLTDYNDQIYISARAIDEINVQLIMERLGGGGHLNIAGAQLAGRTVREAIDILKNTIIEMQEEGEI